MRGMGGMTVLVAALVFTVAATVFGSTVVNAVRVVEPVVVTPEGVVAERGGQPSATPETEGQPALEAGARNASLQRISYPNVTTDEILATVNQDLFQPDRTPRLERYQLPSERVAPAPAQEQDRRARGPEFRIVGAALMGDMAVALVQVGDIIPVALLIGESIEGYTLAAVSAESATLVGAGGMMTLPVVAPLRGAAERNRAEPIQIRGGNIDAATLQNRVREMLQMQRGQTPTRGNRGGGGGGDLP